MNEWISVISTKNKHVEMKYIDKNNKQTNLMHLQILEWMPSNACHIACHSRKSKTQNCDHAESHWNYKHRLDSF